MKKNHMWTMKELRIIKDQWSSKSVDDIAEELGVKKQQIQYIVTLMRKEGIKLPHKHWKGVTSNLIKEFARSL